MAKWNCTVTLINNTIANNTCEQTGNGICTHSSGVFSGWNNIIYFNGSGANNQVGAVYGGGATSLNYSCCSQSLTGIGNITDDPLFVDSNSDDYHLQQGSPCIDTGDPNSPLDPDSTRADMGALYYDQTGIDEVADIPIQNLSLFPNPGSEYVNLDFSLSNPGKLNIGIYNIAGQLVRHLVDQDMAQGNHNVIWHWTDDSGMNLSSGTYIFRIEAGANVVNKVVVLVK